MSLDNPYLYKCRCSDGKLFSWNMDAKEHQSIINRNSGEYGIVKYICTDFREFSHASDAGSHQDNLNSLRHKSDNHSKKPKEVQDFSQWLESSSGSSGSHFTDWLGHERPYPEEDFSRPDEY